VIFGRIGPKTLFYRALTPLLEYQKELPLLSFLADWFKMNDAN
jgi:hypothetical protein